MDKKSLALIRKLERPVQEDEFVEELVENDIVYEAAMHPNEDVRTLCLYLIELLMQHNPERTFGILEVLIKSENTLSLQTCAQFLEHSDSREDKKLQHFSSMLIEKLHSLPRDEGTLFLIEGLSTPE